MCMAGASHSAWVGEQIPIKGVECKAVATLLREKLGCNVGPSSGVGGDFQVCHRPCMHSVHLHSLMESAGTSGNCSAYSAWQAEMTLTTLGTPFVLIGFASRNLALMASTALNLQPAVMPQIRVRASKSICTAPRKGAVRSSKFSLFEVYRSNSA